MHVWLASRHPNHEHAACLSCSFHIQKSNYLEHNEKTNRISCSFIFSCSGLGATRHDIMTLLHLATGSPSGFLRIVEPFSLAEWHDIWMPWDAHGATWQMVLHDAQNLHMLHNICYSVLGRSDSELVSVVSVLRLAKQIFCLRISFGVSIRYCPACRCDSLRLDRHSNLPDAACQLVMLVDSKDAAWSSLSSFTKPILRSAMQSGAYNSRRRNHLQHSES